MKVWLLTLPLKKELKRTELRVSENERQFSELDQLCRQQKQEFENLQAKVKTFLAACDKPSDLDEILGQPTVVDEEVELELLHRRQALEKGAA